MSTSELSPAGRAELANLASELGRLARNAVGAAGPLLLGWLALAEGARRLDPPVGRVVFGAIPLIVVGALLRARRRASARPDLPGRAEPEAPPRTRRLDRVGLVAVSAALLVNLFARDAGRAQPAAALALLPVTGLAALGAAGLALFALPGRLHSTIVIGATLVAVVLTDPALDPRLRAVFLVLALLFAAGLCFQGWVDRRDRRRLEQRLALLRDHSPG